MRRREFITFFAGSAALPFPLFGRCAVNRPSPDDIECNSQDRRCNARCVAVIALG
jgi:hypothetical protein